MTILGIDYGEKRIGLALADPKSGNAWPYQVVKNTGREAVEKITREVIALEDVTAIVIGIPFTLQGKEGAAAGVAREFGSWAEKNLSLPVSYIDERFTSAEAARLAEQYGTKEIDAIAAFLILKTYLEKMGASSPT